jgi:hypothetical protein
MSKIKLPFQKTICIRDIARVSGENKSNVCYSCFGKCHFATTSFDMWMSKGAYDVFTLDVNFLGNDW